jgi:pilus assembly protein Flp/PilA
LAEIFFSMFAASYLGDNIAREFFLSGSLPDSSRGVMLILRDGHTAPAGVQRAPEPSSHPLTQHAEKVMNFLQDDNGATAIEYGLIAGLVAVAVIAALTALGGSLNNLFSDISDTVAASSG